MDAEFEKRRKPIDWEALGMSMPQLGSKSLGPREAPDDAGPRDLTDEKIEEALEEVRAESQFRLYLPDSSGPPVDEEARKLLRAMHNGELSSEKVRELHRLIETYKGWADAEYEILSAEGRRRRELGIDQLKDQLADSLYGDRPLPLAEEARICRELAQLEGKKVSQVVEKQYAPTPASGRMPEILRLLSDEEKS
jgi:hypothetical protein